MSAIKEILSRCILDGEFFELLKSNPAEALLGYEIKDHHREILIARDSRMLLLLGEAHLDDRKEDRYENDSLTKPVNSQTSHSSNKQDVAKSDVLETGESSATNPVAMIPTELVVRLVPYAVLVGDDSNSSVQLTYTTHISQLPDSGSLDNLPPLPIEESYGQPLPPLAVQISIHPHLTQSENGQLISFVVQSQVPSQVPLQPSNDQPVRKISNSSDENLLSITKAVAAVHAASSEHRMARLMDLINEVQMHESQLESQA